MVVRFLKLWKHSWKYQPNVGKIHFSSLFHMFPSTVTQLQFCVPLVRQNIILPRAYDRGCSQCSSQEAWGKRRAKILQSHTLSDLITKWDLPQNILWSYELYIGDTAQWSHPGTLLLSGLSNQHMILWGTYHNQTK